MATGKKSFVFYTNWRNIFQELPKEKGYDLLMHMLAYVNDEDPQTDDVLINAVFAGMKNQLKDDLKNWEGKQKQRSAAGKASAAARQRKATTVNERSVSSTVNGNVSVNGNGKKTIQERKAEFKNSLYPHVEKYGSKMITEFFEYWSEHGEKDKKMRFEKERSYNLERRLRTWKSREKDFRPAGAPKGRDAMSILKERHNLK